MGLAKPGDIKQHCDPNRLSTFLEYLLDYATPETREARDSSIASALATMDDWPRQRAVQRMDRVLAGERDVYCWAERRERGQANRQGRGAREAGSEPCYSSWAPSVLWCPAR